MGASANTLLADGACAGKAQMHRQKLVAHRSATYLWVHYVRAAAPGAGRAHPAPARGRCGKEVPRPGGRTGQKISSSTSAAT